MSAVQREYASTVFINESVCTCKLNLYFWRIFNNQVRIIENQGETIEIFFCLTLPRMSKIHSNMMLTQHGVETVNILKRWQIKVTVRIVTNIILVFFRYCFICSSESGFDGVSSGEMKKITIDRTIDIINRIV